MWCFAQPNQWSSDRIDLDSGEVHHAVNVMRLKDGDAVTVFDGNGKHTLGALRIQGKREAHIEARDVITQPRNSLGDVNLAAAICKPARWEWMLEKCAEAGLGSFTPLLTDHCVSRPAAGKVDKWNAIFIRACKQSHNAWLPVLSPITSLTNWLSSDIRLKLAGAITDDAQPLAKILPQESVDNLSIGVAIGPEGDFSASEYEQLRSDGVHMLSLGSRTLRCETAALYVLHALQYEIERQHHA